MAVKLRSRGPRSITNWRVTASGAQTGETMARPSPEDRLDIIETCTRFGWHADRREWDRFAEVVTDELYVDYTALVGGEPGDVKSADLIAGWKEQFARL